MLIDVGRLNLIVTPLLCTSNPFEQQQQQHWQQYQQQRQYQMKQNQTGLSPCNVELTDVYMVPANTSPVPHTNLEGLDAVAVSFDFKEFKVCRVPVLLNPSISKHPTLAS